MTKTRRYKQSATCRNKSSIVQNRYCTLQSFHLCSLSSDCIVFVDASQFKLIWNIFQLLFICLFTRSHKSSVLFLLLLCVVLVLYSYQESTLLWRPWIPLMKIKLCVMNIDSQVFISDLISHFPDCPCCSTWETKIDNARMTHQLWWKWLKWLVIISILGKFSRMWKI